MANLSDLQITRMKRTTEMIDTNYLGQALQMKPEISNTLAYIYGDRYPISYLTQGSGRISEKHKVISATEFEWNLMGKFFKSVPIKAVLGGNHSKVGVGFSPFTLVFPEKYFQEGELIRFPYSGMQARAQSDSEQTGVNEFATPFVINGSDPGAFIPASDLEENVRVSLLGNAYEEASEGGPSKTASPMSLRSQMTISRWQWSMTGSAQTEAIAIAMKGDGGKKKMLWQPVEEWHQSLMWAELAERMRWYGVNNKTKSGEIFVKGKNGRVVRTGAGILEQISPSKKREYTFLDEDFLQDFLIDLTLDMYEAENRKLVMFTGSGGMKVFHNALKDAISNATLVDTTFVHKKAEGKLGFGAYFTTYKGLLGSEITLVRMPMRDNKELFPALHPETQLPYESYRMTFLDFSDYEGEPNISLVAKGAGGVNRSMIQFYTAGAATPDVANAVPTGKVMRSNSKDSFDWHLLSETGTKMINPLSSGELYMRAV